LGGGEPTTHPDFARIVEAFGSAGVAVNITSRNAPFWRDWLTEGRKGVRAVAFSIDNAADVVRIKGILNSSGVNWDSWGKPFDVHFQIVMGTFDVSELDAIMDAVGSSRLTLLGYKDTGRGAEARGSLPIMAAPEQSAWVDVWLDRVRRWGEGDAAWFDWRERMFDARQYGSPGASDDSRERYLADWLVKNPEPRRPVEFKPNIAIDTTLAAICSEKLKSCKIPPQTYHTEEGAFSLYIDAVSGQMGPCSYAPEHMRPYFIDNLWEEFAQIPVLNG
jgi:hypothetical protein